MEFIPHRRVDMTTLMTFLFLCCHICCGKILKYNLLNDNRKQFTLSTFGFLQKGTLDVQVTGFSYKILSEKPSGKDTIFGFTLDKSETKEVSSYIENMENKCILRDASQREPEKSVSMVFFTLDTKKKRLIVNRYTNDTAHLLVTQQERESYLEDNHLQRRDTSVSLASLSDTSLLSRHVRQANSDKSAAVQTKTDTSVGPSGKTAGNSASSTDKPSKPADKPPKQPVTPAKKQVVKPVKNAPDNTLIFPLNETDGVFTGHFLVAIRTKEEEGLYNLFFHNCYTSGLAFNLSLIITEDNNGNFLSAGEMPEPILYFTFSFIFFITGCLWLGVLKKSQVYKIHFLMLSVIFVKALSSIFHGVNSYFIQITGIHEETWAILYYIVYLFRGALMFVTILLIGAGWAFIKHMLSIKEKKLFLIVIPLQILDQVAWVILEESEEGQVSYTTWKEIFILFDLLCCGAILFPVVWSIRHLQEASRTDGKAAMNLNKLKLFRQFYILIVCFIYFTRIIVYLLKCSIVYCEYTFTLQNTLFGATEYTFEQKKITLPFKLVWLTEFFKEIATLTFFVVTGYKFRPADDNPYLQVPQDSDDEIEMEEVLTETGLTEGLVRVNQRYDEKSESTEPLVKQRESSHEYD